MGWEDGDPLADMTSLHIILPEVDKWCKERGYWWQITSKPGVDSYEVVIFGASYDKYWRENDPDRITAILKAVVAAGGEG